MRGIVVRGILPGEEAGVTELAAQAKDVLAGLTAGSGNVVLGVELAKALRVQAGDKVSLVLPGGDRTAAGIVPRLGTLTVAGTFDAGHFEYDNGLALVHLDDAEKLFRLGGPNGLRLRLKDLEQAPRVAAELEGALGPGAIVRDWTETNRNWFASVQIQKRLLSIILTLIVAVAAFNLVSTLVMTGDRQARRHRDPAHPRRDAAFGDGHLHRPGRGLGRDRHAGRRAARPRRRLQHRRHRAGDRAAAARELPARAAST
jgi:lipoprotein-releasing system permease protein